MPPRPAQPEPAHRPPPEFHLRPIQHRHLPALLEIESHCLRPWDEAEFRRLLHKQECDGIAAELDGKVVGYVVYEMGKARIHLLGLAVHREHRRLGIGRRLLDRVAGRLSHRRRVVQSDVPETLLDVQLFLKDFGFRSTRVLPNWFESPAEDAYLFEYVWQDPDKKD